MRDKYFVFAPEGCGFETFKTEEEAIEAMGEEMRLWDEDAIQNGEWSSLADTAIMGKITHRHSLIESNLENIEGHILALEHLKDDALTLGDGIMNDKELYQEVIKKAGYGIQLHTDNKERFIQKRLIDVAYRLGVKVGMKDKKTIDKMISEFDEA